MLRIIGGDKKGRLILSPKNVRPILSRIKKSVFDIIRSKLLNSVFLDLYAGSGCVGLEALSRGASYSIFVEKKEHVIQIINKNIACLNYQSKSYVIRADVLNELYWIDKTRKIAKMHSFSGIDIVFIGAPYILEKNDSKEFKYSNFSTPTLRLLYNSEILKKDSLVVVQHSIKEKIDPFKFYLFRQEKYGDTLVSFYRI